MIQESTVQVSLAKYTPHSAYKLAGMGWLEAIPEHWEEGKLKHGFETRLGKMLQPEAATNLDTLEPYLRSANITWEGVDTTDIKEMWFSPYEKSIYSIIEGDLLVCEGGDVGRAAIWHAQIKPCFIQNAVHRIRSKKGYSNRFLYYWLYTLKQAGYIDLICSKATISHLTAIKLRDIPLPLVPLNEQRAIASFLDRETAKTDALIAKKERLIELLQDKRLTLIAWAVTKGIDRNAPMMDSTVAWLGEVPSHWEVRKIKRLCLVKRGASPRPIDDPTYFDELGEYAWVRISDVTASTKYLFTTEQKLSLVGKSKSVALEPGELFLSIAATVGKPIITKIKCCIHDGFVYFVGLNENKEYLYYLFSTGELYKGLGKIGTQLNLNTDTIGDIRIPVPPREEQQRIVTYLDDKTAHIDRTISKIREAIEKLREYRSALITAAVTGKIDVREEVAA